MNQLDAEKLFYERFWALHNDPELVRVFKHFGPGIFRRSSVLEGFEAAIQNFEFKGKVCVEIGSCNGLTAVVLARYFEQVISLDIIPSIHKHEVIEFLGIKRITFVDIAGNEDKAAALKRLDFDGAYVDGNHDQDTNLDFGLVRKCKQVLFHEYWQAQPPVWNLVNELRHVGRVAISGKLALWRG